MMIAYINSVTATEGGILTINVWSSKDYKLSRFSISSSNKTLLEPVFIEFHTFRELFVKLTIQDIIDPLVKGSYGRYNYEAADWAAAFRSIIKHFVNILSVLTNKEAEQRQLLRQQLTDFCQLVIICLSSDRTRYNTNFQGAEARKAISKSLMS